VVTFQQQQNNKKIVNLVGYMFFSNIFDKVGKIDIGNNYEDHLYHHLCEAE